MRYLSNFSNYILEKRDHTKKIRKFANVDKIVDWANKLDSDMALWLANQLVIKLKEDAKKRGFNDDDLKNYLNGPQDEFYNNMVINQKLNKVLDNVINILEPYFRKVLDYVNSPLHDVKPNINKLSLNDALQKSDEWHKEIEKYQGKQIEDEEGEIIMTFPDGFYWIDLQTTRCEKEAEAMGHCGNTNEGTTILSLRRKQYPYVTIAYDENEKKFTQIKGRGNKKPVERYHKYIVDLIIKLEVKKFKSEYDRSTDFLPEDLSEELYKKLEEENPDYIEGSKGYTIEEMRKMYYDDIKDDIREYAFMFTSTFFNHLNDERFMTDVIENEKENSELESITENDLINYITSIIPSEKYVEYLKNKIDEDDDLDEEEKEYKKSHISDYINNDMEENDLIEMIKDLDYEDEINEKAVEDMYKDFSAKEYIEELYGKTDELDDHLYKWLYEYLDDDAFAREISDDEHESYLEERYNQ